MADTILLVHVQWYNSVWIDMTVIYCIDGFDNPTPSTVLVLHWNGMVQKVTYRLVWFLNPCSFLIEKQFVSS